MAQRGRPRKETVDHVVDQGLWAVAKERYSHIIVVLYSLACGLIGWMLRGIFG